MLSFLQVLPYNSYLQLQTIGIGGYSVITVLRRTSTFFIRFWYSQVLRWMVTSTCHYRKTVSWQWCRCSFHWTCSNSVHRRQHKTKLIPRAVKWVYTHMGYNSYLVYIQLKTETSFNTALITWLNYNAGFSGHCFYKECEVPNIIEAPNFQFAYSCHINTAQSWIHQCCSKLFTWMVTHCFIDSKTDHKKHGHCGVEQT